MRASLNLNLNLFGGSAMGNLEAVQQKGEAGAAGAVSEPKAATNNLDFILDIPMQVSVQLGTARMLVRDLLQLGQGSVVELEKLAGEPMDVLVNNKLVARGEVVVVNEKFGIRLTDVVSAAERVQQLS
jgi:flagellar motor switch protein FliN/FliY